MARPEPLSDRQTRGIAGHRPTGQTGHDLLNNGFAAGF
jgi:hypothetical protein